MDVCNKFVNLNVTDEGSGCSSNGDAELGVFDEVFFVRFTDGEDPPSYAKAGEEESGARASGHQRRSVETKSHCRARVDLTTKTKLINMFLIPLDSIQ